MRTSLFAAALSVIATATGAFADTVAFIGPSGWTHNPPAASTDPTRVVDQWQMSGDIATVTFVKDGSTSYSDAVAAVEKNVATNKIKTSTDKDMPCRGAVGHMVEFAYGPDGNRIVVNRLIVPDGSGVDTVTYARAEGESFDSDVKKAETAYCTAS